MGASGSGYGPPQECLALAIGTLGVLAQSKKIPLLVRFAVIVYCQSLSAGSSLRELLSYGGTIKSQTEVMNGIPPASIESEGWLKLPIAQRRSLERIRRVVPSASACGTR